MKSITFFLILQTFLVAVPLQFQSLDVPHNLLDQQKIQTSKLLNISGKSYPLAYHTIARSGDKIGNGTFGAILDINHKPLFISDANDFSSLHEVDNELFMITHFETVPAAMYLTRLKQSPEGLLTAVETRNIDFSAFGGLWLPCAGSVSPWGTHLGSEEYAPDAALLMTQKPMADYFSGDEKRVNLYNYGWIPEVKILNKAGDTQVTKHYALGRFSHELAYVMPDEKTVYMSDDGSNVGLFMFIASKPKDLSSGHLYSARWEQVDHKGKLHWIDLGYAQNKEIQEAIDRGITFKDMFEKKEPIDGVCDAGFSSVNTTFGHECLRLKKGMQTLASRLESRRFAAIKGATTEFRKLEGITYNPQAKELYLSVSEINKGMLDKHKKKDRGGPNHIKLKRNDCGAVYRMPLFKDALVSSSYVAKEMNTLLAGKKDKTPGNRCKLDAIANPDNISYIPFADTLIIGEDSLKGHQNDAIWSYHIATQTLTRILTAPLGAETTSIYYYPDIKGFAYIMATIQHPFGDEGSMQPDKEEDKRAYTGYFGPMPSAIK